MVRSCVKIDLQALSIRLAQEQQRDAGPSDPLDWLAQNGFVPKAGDWHCGQQSIDLLRPNEIIRRRDLEDENSIVFLSPE